MTGFKQFLESGFFAVVSAAAAWWTWNLDWAGAIPALAFMAAFYSLTWMAYSLVFRFVHYIPENMTAGLKKSAFLSVPLITGLLIFHWFYTAGAALLFVGFVLIVWKLPDYIIGYFIPAFDIRKNINKSACRRWVFIFICGMLGFVFAPTIYYQHQYKMAVNHFGADSESVQLSAACFLGEFALSHKAYYGRVVEVFSARVRQLTKNKEESNKDSDMALHMLYLLGTLQKDQKIITKPINLRHANLKGFSLEELDFRDAVLLGTNLSGTLFFHTDLSNANAKYAVLNKARMRYMDANETDFFLVEAKDADCRHSRFRKASFTWGEWKGSKFYGSDLRSAVIRGRALKNVSLYKARMQNVNAIGAHFHESDFRGARLDEGDFQRARFDKANLRGASLRNANLKEAVFVDADLRNADLTGAKFQKADFSGANLKGAKGLEGVVINHDGLAEKISRESS
jgi:uncharacterized protein YjbI with pentapeptide repeats